MNANNTDKNTANNLFKIFGSDIDDTDSYDDLIVVDTPAAPVVPVSVPSSLPFSFTPSVSVSSVLEPSEKKARGITEREYGIRTQELFEEIVHAFPNKEQEARHIFSYGGDLMHINCMHHDHMLDLYNELTGENLTF